MAFDFFQVYCMFKNFLISKLVPVCMGEKRCITTSTQNQEIAWSFLKKLVFSRLDTENYFSE